MVISSAGSPPVDFGPSTRLTPLRIGSRPVSRAARLGEQTGDAQ